MLEKEVSHKPHEATFLEEMVPVTGDIARWRRIKKIETYTKGGKLVSMGLQTLMKYGAITIWGYLIYNMCSDMLSRG